MEASAWQPADAQRTREPRLRGGRVHDVAAPDARRQEILLRLAQANEISIQNIQAAFPCG
jgi:hypothetical protein